MSHGCIRLEKAAELAEFLLQTAPVAIKNHAAKILSQKGNQQLPVPSRISLPAPLPVYVGYWTAWTDENGKVKFADDIYGVDVPNLN